MTIQTAKHIEVSYTLRVQVETAKKPIIIDHLPITVSNFTKTASDALMDRIGWVPGLSALQIQWPPTPTQTNSRTCLHPARRQGIRRSHARSHSLARRTRAAGVATLVTLGAIYVDVTRS